MVGELSGKRQDLRLRREFEDGGITCCINSFQSENDIRIESLLIAK